MELIIDHVAGQADLYLAMNWFFWARVLILASVSTVFIYTDLTSRKIIPLLAVISTVSILIAWLLVDWRTFLHSLSGTSVMIMIFLSIYSISGKKIGLGDMLYMALFAASFGWLLGILAFLFSFWSATLILIVPMRLARINKQTRIPFIPFQFLGCLLAILAGFYSLSENLAY
jgi:prepilin signal peptidase PulO-like enzyme (type II secretory pathway)